VKEMNRVKWVNQSLSNLLYVSVTFICLPPFTLPMVHPASPLHPLAQEESLRKVFRAFLFEKLGGKCEVCGARDNLVVHHKDNNRHNNSLSNLQLLCPSCHVRIHRNGKFGRVFLERLTPKVVVCACEKSYEEAKYCKRFVGYVYVKGDEKYFGCKGWKPCNLPPLSTLLLLPRSQLRRFVNSSF